MLAVENDEMQISIPFGIAFFSESSTII
jgi:hypothetical protein